MTSRLADSVRGPGARAANVAGDRVYRRRRSAPEPGSDAVDCLTGVVEPGSSHRAAHRRLTRAFAAGLRNDTRGRATLRRITIELCRRAIDAGHPRDEARAVLMGFLTDHSLRHSLDHVSLIDGRRRSDTILDEVSRWIDEA